MVSRILMLYTSLTGNTEMMANAVLKKLEQLGDENTVVVKEFEKESIAPIELLDYDIVFIGVYTWSGGYVPLDAEDFYENLQGMDLQGKVCGVFGSADSYYEQYGTAVKMVYEQLEKLGAAMAGDHIIADVEPKAEDLERCARMGAQAVEMVKEKQHT